MLSSINYSIQCFHEYTGGDFSEGGGPNEGHSQRGSEGRVLGPNEDHSQRGSEGWGPNKGCSLGPTAGMGVRGPNEGCSVGVRGQGSPGSK